ncbi:MAG: hypothetical protein Ta2F_11680 [Termitinemataceae bacterium]|nr:MAG: hypothetical protein Ta2F_11680 [Termitinemataceae bacterium]
MLRMDIADMKDTALAEGRAEGRAEGLAEGEARAKAEADKIIKAKDEALSEQAAEIAQLKARLAKYK